MFILSIAFAFASFAYASEAILAPRSVTFPYKRELDPKGIQQFGLIAGAVNQVTPDFVVRYDRDMNQTVRYEQVKAMLLIKFLKDHKLADTKDKEIAELRKRVAELQAPDKGREDRLTPLEQMLPQPPKRETITTRLKKGE